MNAEDRKILGEHGQILARLDEKAANTWRTVEDIKAGQEKQNGRLRKVEGRVLWLTGAGIVLASGVGVALVRVLT